MLTVGRNAALNRARDVPRPALDWRRAGTVFGVLAAGVAVSLAVARLIQQRDVRQLLAQYIDAPSRTIATGPIAPDQVYKLPDRRAPSSMDPYPADVVAIEADAARCGAQATARFVYGEAEPEFSHVVPLSGDGRSGTIRVFEPVYGDFEGIQFAHAEAGCVTRVAKLASPDRFPLLLSATLQPDWQAAPLYQRRQGWRWLRR